MYEEDDFFSSRYDDYFKDNTTDNRLKKDSTESAVKAQVDTQKTEKDADDSKHSEALEWLKSIVVAVILALAIKMFLFDFVYVDGMSMYPTLETGDRMVLNKIEYLVSSPDYGEIVVLKATPTKDYIKRIIAKAGDTISIRKQVVYLNGMPQTETYVNPEPYEDFGPVTVPEGYYFVMGDNRVNSLDSRYESLGFVPEEDIIGHAVFRFWPFSKFGTVGNGQE